MCTRISNLPKAKKLHRQAVELREVGHAFDEAPLFKNGHFLLEAGSRLAIIGENGVGKTTLLRCLVGELTQSQGTIKWSENASIGYCAQDNSAEFDNDLTVFEWMSQWRTAKHDDLIVRGILGRLLFSADDVNKKSQKLLRRREKSPDVRQVDDARYQCDCNGRTDQPHGYGSDRITQ